MTYGANKSNDIEYELKSPDGKIEIKINIGDKVNYSVKHGNTTIIKNSPISYDPLPIA